MTLPAESENHTRAGEQTVPSINETQFGPSWLLVRVAPTALLVAAAAGLAWLERGSIAAADWLPYAILASLLLATVLVFDNVNRTNHPPLAAFAAMIGLAAWTGLSLAWSPVPSLARDEGLLVSLYAISLAIPVLTLRGDRERIIALGVIASALAATAVATGAALRFGDGDPRDLFLDGRLIFPVSYVNAQAAVFLVGFWPACVLAARRTAPVAARGAMLGGATAMLAGWLLTQSKGGVIALAISAIPLFALAPGRVRLLVPVGIATALVALAFEPLTEPFRVRDDPQLLAAIRDGGAALLWVALAGSVAGVAVALVDRRIALPALARRVVGATVLVALVAVLAAGAARVDDPAETARDKWEAFKTLPNEESGVTHLVNLGSNRYDFWRVALAGFRDHPVAGIGARGFGTVYLEDRRSVESPARTHSLPFELLLETGVIGLALLLAAIVPLFVLVARRAREPWGAAALGAASYWFVHASGDWIWTSPAAGVPLFALLGVAVSGASRGVLRKRLAVPGGIAAAIAAILLFAPPWLSARVTEQALSAEDPGGLDLARSLDPLSVEPLIARATLADTPAAAAAPLQEAIELEPRSSALHYLLGLAYLDAGRRPAAREELREALRLDPRSELVAVALARAGGSRNLR